MTPEVCQKNASSPRPVVGLIHTFIGADSAVDVLRYRDQRTTSRKGLCKCNHGRCIPSGQYGILLSVPKLIRSRTV